MPPRIDPLPPDATITALVAEIVIAAAEVVAVEIATADNQDKNSIYYGRESFPVSRLHFDSQELM